MTVSGVSTFSVNLTQLINSAFQLAEIIQKGQVLDDEDFDLAKFNLNMMIKTWQNRGYGLWLNQIVTLPQAQNQQSYLLGPTGDHCSANMGETAIKTAGAAGDLTIEVDAITDMVTGQYIGIQLDDGTMQWTTINGAPSGTTVTITAALTDSMAVDNIVFFYTSKIARPLEIIEARIRDKNGIDNPLQVLSLQDYKDLSVKSTYGKVNQVAYDPQLVNGVLYVWEPTYDVTDRIVMTIKRPVYDFVNATDTPDFPIEWVEALEAGLAERLAFKFAATPQKKTELMLLAKQRLDDADWYDREKTFVTFVATEY